MFEGYSHRARLVIFSARHIAGQYGSNTLDTDHVLLALIREDQGEIEKALPDAPNPRLLRHSSNDMESKPHESFWSSDVASDLLHKIEETLPQSAPLPPSVDIPMSPDLKQVLGKAAGIMDRVGESKVEPLHILAAAVAEGSTQGAIILRNAGTTEEKVLEAITGRGRSSN